ncbi:MAG: diguanylate cyclase [Burkholderiaceae bacterium]|nr:diguanylate cyclase [Sulfuritalea sp.]MCF8173846.1 diguanylate cyclase [Burkholderiaceae bacterium]
MSENGIDVVAQLAGLSEEFRQSVPLRTGAIESAFAALKKDWDDEALLALRDAAHRLAGAAGTFGCNLLGECSRQIEELAQCLSAEPARRDEASREALSGLLAELRSAAAQLSPVMSESDAPQPVADQNLLFLVDDDLLLGAKIAETLGQYGYRVRVFESPAEMLDVLRTTQPDALLFDLMFPEGLLDRELIAKARALAAIPVVIISVRDDLEARLHALRGGCEAYFTKPIDIAGLVDRLDDLLHRTENLPARVLVVEDDEMTARALVAMLASGGIQAEVAGRPEEALARLRDVLPDLILMDMYLPGCRGDELAAVIRQIDTWQGVPITYLSVESDREKQLDALELGGDDFLQKPIARDHLLRAVGARIKRARRLRALMTRDSLTNLLNHARFLEQFEVEGMRAKRSGKALSVAMIDLDHFKAVNDRHGHAVGDLVIKSLARLLQQRLRQVDVIGRYGGEEFAVVLPETSAEAAQQVLEEIGLAFAGQRFGGADGEFSVTFSAGIASLDNINDPRQLIEAADHALYEAKRLGRNRVEIASAAVKAN